MQSQIKKQPNSSIELKVEVTAREMVSYFQKALEKIRQDFALEGFRKGYVPEEIILQKVGRPAVEAESVDLAVQQSYIEAIRENKISPVAPPKIEIKKFAVVASEEDKENKEDIALEYSAVVDVFPEIEIKDYRSIRIEKNPKDIEVADREVEEVITQLTKQRAILESIDRPLEKGDWSEIEFTGSVDGALRDDLKSKNMPVVLGDGRLIPGFEEELAGLKKGEEKKFQLIFPKDYPSEFLRKKLVEFQVKILDVKKIILPAVDNKFAGDFGHRSVDELKSAIRKNLIEEKEKNQKLKIEEEIVEELIRRTRGDLSASLIEEETERLLAAAKDRLANIKFDWSKYLNQIKKTEEEFKKELRVQAEKNVKIGLIFGKIAAEEGIDVHDKEGAGKVMERLVEYASN